MLISVVIPTHNRAELLLEAVRSVAAQTHRDWEVVVIDDGSEPPVTASALVEAFGTRVRVLRHAAARGVPKAKNAGVLAARGEIILLLDDDDLLVPAALQRIGEIYEAHPAIDCLFLGVEPFGQYADGPARSRESALGRIRRACKPIEKDDAFLFSGDLFEALLPGVPIDFQRPAARRGTWNIVGGFDENSLFSESAWAIRTVAVCAVALTKEPLTRWRIHDNNFGWPAGLDAHQIKARQIDNGLRATEELLRAFAARESLASAQCRRLTSTFAGQLFDSAYHYRDIDRRKGFGFLLRSIRVRPQWRQLRLALTYLVPAFGKKGGADSAVGSG
jgi:glycosyltransferase involved in cell wall biosynthesis